MLKEFNRMAQKKLKTKRRMSKLEFKGMLVMAGAVPFISVDDTMQKLENILNEAKELIGEPTMS